MFLIRLIHLNGFKPKKEKDAENLESKNEKKDKENEISSQFKSNETINQIKNIAQEKKTKPQPNLETKDATEISITSFNNLLDTCYLKKEVKLKYELEKNVNLVKFEKGRIEISFNDNLDKDFVKDLSSKLLKWTNQRWIISFSKTKGEMSIKDKEKSKQTELIEKAKKSDLYQKMLSSFPDAELIDVKTLNSDKE